MGSDDVQLKVSSDDVAWRRYGDEVVLLDLRSSSYLATNPAATLLWRLLEQGTTRAALVAELVENFAVEEAVAAADVDEFLADCRRRELLVEG